MRLNPKLTAFHGIGLILSSFPSSDFRMGVVFLGGGFTLTRRYCPASSSCLLLAPAYF